MDGPLGDLQKKWTVEMPKPNYFRNQSFCHYFKIFSTWVWDLVM